MAKGFEGLLQKRQSTKAARNIAGWQGKCKTLVESCHPKQRAFVQDPGRRVCALVGRGGGKTTGAKCRFLVRMLSTPAAHCRYFATTRGHAEELLWNPLKETCDKLELKAQWNESKLRMTLANGSFLHLVGCDNRKDVEKHRGLPNHEVILDEGGSHEPRLLDNLVYRIIGPRLGDYRGSLAIIGTPSHQQAGVFWDATRPGSDIARLWEDRDQPEFASWENWSQHTWTLQDGAEHIPALANLWAEALVEKKQNGWDDDHPVWLREYMGRWASDNTEKIYKYSAFKEVDGKMVQWNQWDPPRRGPFQVAELPGGFNWQYVYGSDLGHGDDYTEEVFAFALDDPEKRLLHVAEFVAKEMYPRRIAEHLIGTELNADKPSGLIGETGYPVGHVADSEGLGQGYLDELRDVHGIFIKKADKKDKLGKQELFNGDLIDGRTKILKGSKAEQQLSDLEWYVDEYGRIKEKPGDRNDAADAAVYARTEAHHQLGVARPAPPPAAGSHEAALQQMREQDEAHDRGESFEEFESDWEDNPDDW